MLFNSLDFAIFLPIVFVLYWFVLNKNLKVQNMLLLVASYVFYAFWDWRFIVLIVFSTVVNYIMGILLGREEAQRKRKLLIWVSVIINLGLLCYFKYTNFFIESFRDAFMLFGKELNISTLNIILPVGISFYTFQTMSYTIDIYRRQFSPTKDLIAFAAFVGFFPQLAAGPIERAQNFLPQFLAKRTFDYGKAVDGLRQMLWGYLKKIVIADNCAEYVDMIFNGYTDYSGSTLALGIILFSFQIYGDFSGYSDMAIGMSRLFGFNLRKNFAFPIFARDVAEFWRRWHISLSTWFRDYLYIPLGGSRGGTWMKIRNTFIIFLVSGFWHGADWTFVIWGGLNAVFFLPLMLAKKNRKNLDIVAKGKILPSFRELWAMVGTFGLITLSRVFFRGDNMAQSMGYFSRMFSRSLFSVPEAIPKMTILLVIVFVIVEWIGREGEYAIEKIGLKWKRPLRYAMYLAIVFAIFWLGGEEQEFIYFQF